MDNISPIFDLFVTTVESEGPLLKIWGQTEHKAILTIEEHLLKLSPEFDMGKYVPNIATLQLGQICFGKYNDGVYYRTKILDLNRICDGEIIVHFIDYGNVESLPLTSIRIIENVHAVPVGFIPPLANEYILAGSIHYARNWDDKSIECVSQMVCNLELKAVIVALVGQYKLIRMELKGRDLSAYLIQMGIALPITVTAQELMLNQTLHIKNKMIGQSIPQNPHVRQLPSMASMQPTVRVPFKQPALQKSNSVENRIEYKSTMLPISSEHKVTISAVEDGPKLFSVQLQSWEKNLTKIMMDVNSIRLVPLTEFPVPGTLCIAHCKGQNYLCRAVITQIVDLNVKVYFVDFGHSDIVDHCSIFNIPPELVSHKIIALRFTLVGLKSIGLTTEAKQFFKEYVKEKIFTLKVCAAEGPPLVQYGELYDENGQSILEILKQMQTSGTIKYRTMKPLETDCIADILISYVKSCQEFYVHLLFNVDSLTRLMNDIAVHCDRPESLSLTNIKVGMACCAYYFEDEQWYRAEVISVEGRNIRVKYVDYGNEALVAPSALKEITPELVSRLDIQAIMCCLNGFENLPVDNILSAEFETLALENKFTMKILSYRTTNTLLVDLTDSEHNSITEVLKLKSVQKVEEVPTSPTISKSENYSDNQKKQYDKKPSKQRNTDKPPSFDDSSDSQQSTDYNKKSSYRGSFEGTKFSKKVPQDKRSYQDGSQRPQEGAWRSQDNFRKSSQDNYRRSPQDNFKRLPQDNFKRSPQDNFKKSSRDNFKKSSQDSFKKSPQDNFRSPQENVKKQLFQDNDNNWGGNKFDRNKNDSRDFNRRPRNSSREKFTRKEDSKSFNSREDSKLKKKWRGDSSDSSFGSSKSNSKGEKSWKSNKGSKYEQNEKQEKPTETSDYAPLEQQYSELEITEGMIETVGISWFYNPKYFYCQVTSSQDQFRKMMANIQKIYRERSPLSGSIPVGSSVIALFPEDSQLYRATVIEARYPKYRVRYVDFGNTSFVDKQKLWQVENSFMQLPIQTVKCALTNVYPTGTIWNDSEEMDNCFNKENYQCVFYGLEEDKRIVELSLNGQLVIDKLINERLALRESIDAAQEVEQDTSQLIPGIESNIDDAPVDLDLLIGQKILVHISFIFGLERFFIQIDKKKVATVLSAVSFYNENKSKLEQLEPEQLITGTVCLVQLEGETLQRGIIMDVNSTNGIYVEFVDIGGGDEFPRDKMFALPPDLYDYYYQALECLIHNFHSNLTPILSDEEFKGKYENTDAIAVINEIQNGRLFVGLYNLDGSHIELFENSKCGNVDPLCPMLVTTSQIKVWISHVNSVDSIFIQRLQDSDSISQLLEQLYNHYETENTLTEISEIIVDKTYAVKSTLDGNWYRGRVVEKTPEGIEVLYIDYGNTEVVDKLVLRDLDPIFYSPHEFSLQVSLPVTSDDESVKAKIEELAADKEFLTKLAFTDGWWYAELYENNIALSQILVESKLAINMDFDPFKRRQATDCTSRIELYVTHVDSPNEFYARLTDDESSVKTLQEELCNEIESLATLGTVDAGVLCAAKYSADGIWYRAEVLDADEHITTVRFIDYGNTDVLDNNSGVIKMLPSRMLAIERYAKKCSLDIMPISGEEWSQNICESFEQKIIDKIVSAEILYQDEKGTVYLNIFFEDVSLSISMVEDGVGIPITRNVEEEISTKTGFISHIESIEEFWIQFESSCPDLEMMTDQLAEAEQFPELIDRQPGVLCAAKFPEDNMWYRGRILTVTGAGIEVLFVDYGNSSISIELKILPEDIVNIRSLAMKCSLRKPDTILKWPSIASEKFKDISADGATVFNVKVLTTGETSTVELTENGTNIIDKILSQTVSLTPVNEVTYQEVIISHVESPQSFWVQDVSQLDDLNVLLDQLTEIDGSLVPTVEIGKCYAALFPEDECWYRINISEINENSYQGFFIDFGNSSVVTQLKEISEDLINIPPYAKHCVLQLPSSISCWPDSAVNKFKQIAEEETEHNFRLEILENNISSLTVKLFLNDREIGNEILESNLPDESNESASFKLENVVESENTGLNNMDVKTESDNIVAKTNKESDSKSNMQVKSSVAKDENKNEHFDHASAVNDVTHIIEETLLNVDKNEVDIENRFDKDNVTGEVTQIMEKASINVDKSSIYSDNEKHFDTEGTTGEVTQVIKEMSNVDKCEVNDNEEIFDQHDALEEQVTRSDDVTGEVMHVIEEALSNIGKSEINDNEEIASSNVPHIIEEAKSDNATEEVAQVIEEALSNVCKSEINDNENIFEKEDVKGEANHVLEKSLSNVSKNEANDNDAHFDKEDAVEEVTQIIEETLSKVGNDEINDNQSGMSGSVSKEVVNDIIDSVMSATGK